MIIRPVKTFAKNTQWVTLSDCPFCSWNFFRYYHKTKLFLYYRFPKFCFVISDLCFCAKVFRNSSFTKEIPERLFPIFFWLFVLLFYIWSVYILYRRNYCSFFLLWNFFRYGGMSFFLCEILSFYPDFVSPLCRNLFRNPCLCFAINGQPFAIPEFRFVVNSCNTLIFLALLTLSFYILYFIMLLRVYLYISLQPWGN